MLLSNVSTFFSIHKSGETGGGERVSMQQQKNDKKNRAKLKEVLYLFISLQQKSNHYIVFSLSQRCSSPSFSQKWELNKYRLSDNQVWRFLRFMKVILEWLYGSIWGSRGFGWFCEEQVGIGNWGWAFECVTQVTKNTIGHRILSKC